MTFKNLLNISLTTLNASDREKLAVINVAFTILTYAHNLSDEMKKYFHSMVKAFYKTWISKDSVVGGSMFGGSWDRYYKKLVKKNPEFKVIIAFYGLIIIIIVVLYL